MTNNEIAKDIGQKAFAAADTLTIQRLRTAATREDQFRYLDIMAALNMALIEFNNIIDGDTEQ